MNRKCVIIGSFRKYYNEILGVLDLFQNAGYTVTSPARSWVLNGGDDFVLLDSDETHDVAHIEQNVLDKIREADFVYIYNPGGYIGVSTAFEIGYAHSLGGVRIYAATMPDDVMLGQFVDDVIPVSQICRSPVVKGLALAQ